MAIHVIKEVFCAGLVGLPFGLLLVLVCGAELFSGNTALVGAAVSQQSMLPLSCVVSERIQPSMSNATYMCTRGKHCSSEVRDCV